MTMRHWTLLIVLLSAMSAIAEPAEFTTNVRFDSGSLKVTLINHEIPRNKPYLIVHFEIQNPTREEQRCDWVSLVTLERQDGSTMSSNYDLLVDLGTGGTRATGPFAIPKGRKARASVLFVLAEEDLPGRLLLPDGRRSEVIEFRGKRRP